MGYVKLVLEAFGIFAASIFVLLVVKMLTGDRNVATGMVFAKVYGLLLVVVGIFYVAFGVFLQTPLPERLLRHWSGHLN
jgi:hypothetical protein